MNADRRYREFHGKPPRYEETVDFQTPKQLVYLGKRWQSSTGALN